ncbi:hypothetical protein [Massilia niastensis]|uniref:hypothetical protein n=1 Tax=Massilia niastensis TaxID=544911 RepID=UPI0003683489|nr:hypothetical protein [Massilia niastensis]
MKRTTPYLLAALASLSLAVQAAEPEQLPVKVGFLSEVRVAPVTDDPSLGKKADTTQLAGQRGGSDVINNEASATLSGGVGNNSATNVVTGMNVIQGGSFANSSGLPVVIQNSGANVLIQNATVINLHMQ